MRLFRCSNCRCLISNEDSLCPYCGSNVTILNETVKEPKKFKTKKFDLIIGIVTLIIAICGATFAYFSTTARSAEDDITVKSAYERIPYTGGTEIRVTNLIPVTEQIALTNYKKDVLLYNNEHNCERIEEYDSYNSNMLDRKCVDDKGQEVCYVYQISIESAETANMLDRKCVDDKGQEVYYVYQFSIESAGAVGEFTDILAYIAINRNDFDNLSYALYEVTPKEENGIVESYTEVSKFKNIDTNPIACLFGNKELQEGEENSAVDNPNRCINYPIENQIKHTYHLVIWLEETNHIQEETNATFEGTVIIDVSSDANTNEH